MRSVCRRTKARAAPWLTTSRYPSRGGHPHRHLPRWAGKEKPVRKAGVFWLTATRPSDSSSQLATECNALSLLQGVRQSIQVWPRPCLDVPGTGMAQKRPSIGFRKKTATLLKAQQAWGLLDCPGFRLSHSLDDFHSSVALKALLFPTACCSSERDPILVPLQGTQQGLLRQCNTGQGGRPPWLPCPGRTVSAAGKASALRYTSPRSPCPATAITGSRRWDRAQLHTSQEGVERDAPIRHNRRPHGLVQAGEERA
jgi:hypothetical protein